MHAPGGIYLFNWGLTPAAEGSVGGEKNSNLDHLIADALGG